MCRRLLSSPGDNTYCTCAHTHTHVIEREVSYSRQSSMLITPSHRHSHYIHIYCMVAQHPSTPPSAYIKNILVHVLYNHDATSQHSQPPKQLLAHGETNYKRIDNANSAIKLLIFILTIPLSIYSA